MSRLLTAAFLPLVFGLAQSPPNVPTREARPHPKSPILEALDLNHDGILSADEIASAQASLLKLDKNGDEQLTPDEYRPPRPDGKAQAAPPPAPKGGSSLPKRLERPRPLLDTTLDADGDEVISAQEIAQASIRLRKLDRNGDGKLTPDEYAPKASPESPAPEKTPD